MAQTNYTPISLYYSTTASAVPTAANLVQGELAINTADGKLYYEDSSGVVQVLATKSTGSIGGSNTQVQFNNSGSLGGSSGLTWDGSFLTTSSIKNSALTSGRVTYAGASGLLTDNSAFVFNGNLGLGAATTSGGRLVITQDNAVQPAIYLPTDESTIQGPSANTKILMGGNLTVQSANVTTISAKNASGYIVFATGSTPTEGLRLTTTSLYTASGVNVGIGTSSPTAPLQITTSGTANNIQMTGSGTAGTYVQMTNTGGIFTAGLDNSTGGVFGGSAYSGNLYMNGAYPMLFWTSGGIRMQIDASGNLGLGITPQSWNTGWNALQIGSAGSLASLKSTTGPSLTISNNAYLGASAWNYITTSPANAATQYEQYAGKHIWYNAGSSTGTISWTQAMTLDASGNLLVGTTGLGTIGSSSGSTITASGAIYSASTGESIFSRRSSDGDVILFRRDTTGVGSIAVTTLLTTYNTTSDYRLKTVTGSVMGQGERIDALKPIDYQWKKGNEQARGFLAHEFQTVYPNSVTGTKDDVDADGKPVYQTMQASTAEVIADLVAEIQSLRQRITNLENK
jgi:hypothetical protein